LASLAQTTFLSCSFADLLREMATVRQRENRYRMRYKSMLQVLVVQVHSRLLWTLSQRFATNCAPAKTRRVERETSPETVSCAAVVVVASTAVDVVTAGEVVAAVDVGAAVLVVAGVAVAVAVVEVPVVDDVVAVVDVVVAVAVVTVLTIVVDVSAAVVVLVVVTVVVTTVVVVPGSTGAGVEAAQYPQLLR
jgi:hypothetical protein